MAIFQPAGGTPLGWTLRFSERWSLPKSCSFEDTEYRCHRFVDTITPGGDAAAVGVKAGDKFEGEEWNDYADPPPEAPTYAIFNMERN